MDHHQTPLIRSRRGAARAVDGASHLHGPLRVDSNAETEKKVNGWTQRGWLQRQGTDANSVDLHYLKISGSPGCLIMVRTS
jgi:hypothetical protein